MTPKTVLITGVNGFVAVHVAKRFLENGWHVRGTVRSQSKATQTASLPIFSSYASQSPSPLTFEIVEDISSGDFTKALEGVDAVAHTASPFHMKGEHWSEYREPAVNGTKAILEAAKKVSSIKAIAVTSSFASVGTFSKPAAEQSDKVYTEEDWNPITDEVCQGLEGKDDPTAARQWYLGSKTLAEKKAYEVFPENEGFALATICPPMIFGPVSQHLDSMDALNTSSAAVYGILAGKDKDVPPTGTPAYADVRNVADAHYEAIARQKRGRFVICNGKFDYQQVADYYRENHPELADRITVGKPGDRPSAKVYRLDSSKSEKELGVKYHDFDAVFEDTLQSLLALEKSIGSK